MLGTMEEDKQVLSVSSVSSSFYLAIIGLTDLLANGFCNALNNAGTVADPNKFS